MFPWWWRSNSCASLDNKKLWPILKFCIATMLPATKAWVLPKLLFVTEKLTTTTFCSCSYRNQHIQHFFNFIVILNLRSHMKQDIQIKPADLHKLHLPDPTKTTTLWCLFHLKYSESGQSNTSTNLHILNDAPRGQSQTLYNIKFKGINLPILSLPAPGEGPLG